MQKPTLKSKILSLLSDYGWHSMAEMSRHCSNGNEETVATSVSQRIGNLKQRGIEFEQRHFGSRHWEWKLRTPLDRIDFAHCELKEPADGWYPQGHCLPSSIATKAGSKDCGDGTGYQRVGASGNNASRSRMEGSPSLSPQKDSNPLEPPASLFPFQSRIAKPNAGGSKKIQMEIGI